MIIDPRLYQQISLLPVEATHTALGVCGELLVSRCLCEQGYRQLQSHKRGDLTMADRDGVIVNIEVKTARLDKHGRFQFCIRKPGHTDAQNSHWTVLLAVLTSGKPVPFVVPSVELQAKCVAIGVPGKYAGRLAKYRQHIDSLSLSMERLQ